MPYSPRITIYGALPSFCGGDDCGKILRLADHEGTVEPAWDFEVEGVPGYCGEHVGQFLMVSGDECNQCLAWSSVEGLLPEPGGCGQVLMLADDGCGNPTAAWCDVPGGLPEPGGCGQVLTLCDDGCGNPVPAWCDAPGGLPEPCDCGQVLTLVDDGCGNPTPAWCDAPGGLPEPGGCDQVLMLVDDGNGNPVPAWADPPGGLPGIECGERYLKTVDCGGGEFALEWAELPCGTFDPCCSYDWTACQNFWDTVTIAADLVLADPCCGSNFVVFAWGDCSGERLEVSGPIAFDDVQEMNVTGLLYFSCDGVFVAPNVGCSLPSCDTETGQLVFHDGNLKYYNGSQWKTLQTTS